MKKLPDLLWISLMPAKWKEPQTTAGILTQPKQHLVDWVAKRPQEVAAQLPAQFTWRQKQSEEQRELQMINYYHYLLPHLPYGTPVTVMNISVPTRKYARETQQPNRST